MSKLITALLAGALCSTSYVALAADAQQMDESTNPNRGTDMPTENMQQKPDRTSGSSATGNTRSSRSDREYMDRWSESSGGSGSAGGTGTTTKGTNNPNSNSDVSGGDQIERGSANDPNKVEKLRQKPNPEPQ
ncbi:MAG TPA: hypothetical protein VFF75_08260 [Methylophilaceae bacterium]|nr:hypothetical protein [Methylophilaceae bacterium]